MNNLEKTQAYIKQLNLPLDTNSKAKEALEFIWSLDADRIAAQYMDIAFLFCLCIKKINDTVLLQGDTTDLVVHAFNNIRQCKTDDKNSSVATISFLSSIMDFSFEGATVPEIEGIKDDFKDLCSELEEMSSIFRLVNDSHQEVFPIGKLLNAVIQDEGFLQGQLDETTFNTLLLALEIFKPEAYSAERSRVNQIIDDCNLQCLRLLSNPSNIKVGGNSWKDNLKYNGVVTIVYIDGENKKVFVRSRNKEYFSGIQSADVQIEVNSKRDPVAYFVIQDIPKDSSLISVGNILRSNNISDIEWACRMMFVNHSYNVFFDYSIYKSGEELYTTNPFTSNDNNIILKGQDPIIAVTTETLIQKALKPYYYYGIGRKFDIVLLVSVFLILQIDSTSIDAVFAPLKSDAIGKQDSMISNWLLNTGDCLTKIKQFQQVYFLAVAYAQEKEALSKKFIGDLAFLPFKFPEGIISELVKKEYPEGSDYRVECITAEEGFDGCVYRDIEAKEIELTRIDFGDNEVVKSELFYMLYDCQSDKYVYVQNIDDLMHIKRIIDSENQRLYSIDAFNSIDSMQEEIVVEKMKIQKGELSDINNIVYNFDTIAYIRLMHHIIYARLLEPRRWEKFFSLLSRHQILDFSNIRNLDLSKEGCWVIPKEARATGNVLCSVFRDFTENYSDRNRDFFNSKLNMDENTGEFKLWQQTSKICEIIFLFDTIQNGSSTEGILRRYFENGTNPRGCDYSCNGKIVTISEVIQKNSPTVRIVALFASDKGKESVERYIEKNIPEIKGTSVEALSSINTIADKEFVQLMDEVYAGRSTKDGAIKIGNFPVLRPYNQPKKNVFPEETLDSGHVVSIFVQKQEIPV